ncbi:MAG: DUF2306 domain-containing protein [Pseudomonadota bacterium]
MTYASIEPTAGSGAQDGAAMAAFSRKALSAAATFWFAIAVGGQMVFAAYILSFYAGAAVRGDLAAWKKVLPTFHVAGDTMGNTALIVHVLIAAIVTLGGPLQLIPKVRASFPVCHRWNGRVYFATVVVAAVTGLYVIWSRNGAGSFTQHIAISINAVLILLAALLALRHVLARRLAQHRRWAMRLFLLVSGSWFFRVMLMFWIAVNGGPAGFNPETFRGPALDAIAFLQYLLPLAVLELYFMAKEGASPAWRLATSAGIVALTVAMSVGIVVASMGMWLPHMR